MSLRSSGNVAPNLLASQAAPLCPSNQGGTSRCHLGNQVAGLSRALQFYRRYVFFEWNSMRPFSDVLPLFTAGYCFWQLILDCAFALPFWWQGYSLRCIDNCGGGLDLPTHSLLQ